MHRFSYIAIIFFTGLITIGCTAKRKTRDNVRTDAKKQEKLQTGKDKFLRDTSAIKETSDSLRLSLGDTLANDSIPVDSLGITQDSTDKKKHKSPLEEKVDYHSEDSIIFDVKSKVMYLYDTAQINYKTIELKANYIAIDLNKKELHSKGVKDTVAGTVTGSPEFTDNGQTFTASEMSYNFDTKKGLIKEAITHEGETYLHALVAKKDSNDVIYVKNAKFTTCTDPHPHFYIQTNKGKVIKDKLVVTGPANLRIADVPTPLVLPFGYFPTQSKRTSGFILPEYGELADYGFFLKNMGYYFAINDYLDLTLTGDIYTSLSFGGRATMNYKKRYKVGGNLQLGYSQFQRGDPGLPQDFSQRRDFVVIWSHTQDPKSNPTIGFSASVHVQSGSYNTYNASTVTGIVSNQFQSNISFSKTFPRTPVSLYLNLSHNQNTQTGRVNLSLPNLTLNVTRFFPFRRKKQVGDLRWYENIGMNYSMNFVNNLSFVDSVLTRNPASILDGFNNGIQQKLSISTNLKVLKYFTLNPSINYTEKWHFANLRKFYDPNTQLVQNDTVRGFFTTRDLNATASLTTIIYGMYKFKSKKIKAIRHVVTPTLTAQFRPDLGDQIQGYFGPNGEFISYSPNQIGTFGSSPSGMSGLVRFDLTNNIEMKVASKKDTITGEKKIPLLEVLNIGMFYDFAQDSLNLSNLSISGRTTLIDLITLNFNFLFDPYSYRVGPNGVAQRVNRLEVMETGTPLRLTQASLALGFTFRGERKTDENVTGSLTPGERMVADNPDYYNYVDFNVPYSINIGYNIVYNKPLDKEEITHTINFGGEFNITKKWKVAATINYDIQNNKIATSSFNLYRDLHCWEMRFQIIPFGIRQSYTFTIQVKSPLLQMLKLQRQSGLGGYY